MITANQVKAYNVPSGIVFDMLREGAGQRPGVLTKVGMDTFVDPDQDGCAMNAAARAPNPSWSGGKLSTGKTGSISSALQTRMWRSSGGQQPIENGNLSFEGEGAYLGAMEMALAARNTRWCRHRPSPAASRQNGSIRPHDVRVPGILGGSYRGGNTRDVADHCHPLMIRQSRES